MGGFSFSIVRSLWLIGCLQIMDGSPSRGEFLASLSHFGAHSNDLSLDVISEGDYRH